MGLRRRSGSRHHSAPLIEVLENRMLLTAALDAIPDVTIPGGKAIYVPLTSSDTAGRTIHYDVQSSNPQIVPTLLSSSNTYMQITVANFGTMTFELFNDLAPNTTSHIVSLVNQDLYDGLSIFRIMQGFMMQTGSPTNNGQGNLGRNSPTSSTPTPSSPRRASLPWPTPARTPMARSFS